MTTLKDIIQDKVVSHIPIYSMFDHSTKMINLNCDGNINRWLTRFYKSRNWKHLDVYGPKQAISLNYDQLKDKLTYFENFSYVEVDAIKTNAGHQRSRAFVEEFFNEVDMKKFLKSDVIICEGQEIILRLLQLKKELNMDFKLIYWCPLCNTNYKQKEFLVKDKPVNELIFREVDYTIIVGKDQIQYLRECGIPSEKVIFDPEMMDRNLPFFQYQKQEQVVNALKEHEKVVYLPFRLSDEGYQFWNIVDVLKDLDLNRVAIYCPNVNSASTDELVKMCKSHLSSLSEDSIIGVIQKMRPISSQRDVFYSVLDYCDNVVIPYFEDTDFVPHVAVDEMMHYDQVVAKTYVTRSSFEDAMKEYKNA